MRGHKRKIIICTLMIIIATNPLIANAHKGRTDSNGGHRDNKNVSRLGNYHYHHGYEAHLNKNGKCELRM